MWFYIYRLNVIIGLLQVQEISSCTFGNNLNQLTPSSPSPANSILFLNTVNTSQCPGNATGWNLCYYSSTTDQTSHTVYVSVYRPSASGSSFPYNLVTGSSSSYSTFSINTSYSCIEFSIPQSQQFVVKQGDVIAACLLASGSGRVGILGTTSSTQSQVFTRSTTCTGLPSSITTNQLSAGRSIAIHASLGINECTVNNGGCNQTCVYTNGSYTCSCSSGFQLAPDMKNCIPIDITIAVTTLGTTSSLMLYTAGDVAATIDVSTDITVALNALPTTVTATSNSSITESHQSTLQTTYFIVIISVVSTTVVTTLLTVITIVILCQRKHSSKKAINASGSDQTVKVNDTRQDPDENLMQLNKAYEVHIHNQNIIEVSSNEAYGVHKPSIVVSPNEAYATHTHDRDIPK